MDEGRGVKEMVNKIPWLLGYPLPKGDNKTPLQINNR